MSRPIVSICFLLSLLAPLTANETGWRKWKSTAGTVIEGRVVKWIPCPRVEEAGMEMETSDGRKLKVTYQQLSADDQVWLLQNHKDQLTGMDKKAAEETAAAKSDGKLVIKKHKTTALGPGHLFEPPPEVNFNRNAIPSLGEYGDGSSRAVNLVANHLFWLTKLGYTKYDLGRDETDGWEDIERDVGKRFRSGDSHRIDEVESLVLEMLEREGKGILKIHSLTLKYMGREDLEKVLFGPAVVLVKAFAYPQGTTRDSQWVTVLPVLRLDKDSLVMSYDGEMTTFKLEAMPKPEKSAGSRLQTGIRIPPDIEFYGYRLLADPADSSKLGAKLREDELELRIDDWDENFCVIDMELKVPEKKVAPGR